MNTAHDGLVLCDNPICIVVLNAVTSGGCNGAGSELVVSQQVVLGDGSLNSAGSLQEKNTGQGISERTHDLHT